MSYNTPDNLKYTKDHEWTSIESSDLVTIGITDFAQQSLGDIVFVELPEVGSSIAKEGSFGVVESIKSVSDLFAPLSGKVVEVNNTLQDTPELLNEDPYANWMIKIELSSQDELQDLLDKKAYEKLQVEQ
jgi:glycine cleavage system H protein